MVNFLVTFIKSQKLAMPPHPYIFQPLKSFGDTLIFYFAILPLALANPNVLKDRDSRRDGKKENKDDGPKPSQTD
jgi:hypothetical protein